MLVCVCVCLNVYVCLDNCLLVFCVSPSLCVFLSENLCVCVCVCVCVCRCVCVCVCVCEFLSLCKCFNK